MIHLALRYTRQYFKLKQVDVLRGLNISKSYLSEIESATKKPNCDLLEKYSAFFKIPISSFFLFSEGIESQGIAEVKKIHDSADLVVLLESIIKYDADDSIETKAILFALKAHDGQKRKYTNEPYITHCISVADIVKTVTDDENVICAAYLHDTIEDTNTTKEDIEQHFNKIIADLTFQVTDESKPEDGNRKTRKEIDKNKLARACADAQTLKLADLIHNTQSITQYDPGFAKIYLHEKKELLKVLIKGNKHLFNIALKSLEKNENIIKNNEIV